MKKHSFGSADTSYLYLAESLLLIVLFAIKSFFFNQYIELGSYASVMTAFSVLLIGIVWLVLVKFKARNPADFLFFMYILGSLLMVIDRMYYSYFSRMPSIASVGLVQYLGGVGDSVSALFNFGHAMYILDLPIMLLYLLFWRKALSVKFRRTKFKKIKPKKTARLVSCCFNSALLVFIAATVATESFTISNLKNELFTYHVGDVISVALGGNGNNDVNTDEYIQVLNPTEEEKADLPYLGVASGMNLINIQVEAMQAFLLGRTYNGQEITPFLNSLLETDTIYFENYYYQIGGGNTSDAEFAINNSLLTPATEAAYVKYAQNDYFGLPFILKAAGYSGAHAFHGYYSDFWNRRVAYVYQGFDDFHAREDLVEDDIVGLGVSDMSLYSQALELMVTYEEPFYSFFVTLTSHHPYDIPQNLHRLTLEDRHVGTLFGNYLQTMSYVDSALEHLFNGLREKGLYDNTVVTIYGDHFGLPDYDVPSREFMTEFLGHPYYENDVYKVPMIMHIPGLGEAKTVTVSGSHIDYLPTILHLFGLQNNKSVMFGQNLLTATKGMVYEQTHMARGSFISDDVIFVYPSNGIMSSARAFNKKTGELIDTSGYDDLIAAAKKAYEDSNALLDANSVVINKE